MERMNIKKFLKKNFKEYKIHEYSKLKTENYKEIMDLCNSNDKIMVVCKRNENNEEYFASIEYYQFREKGVICEGDSYS